MEARRKNRYLLTRSIVSRCLTWYAPAWPSVTRHCKALGHLTLIRCLSVPALFQFLVAINGSRSLPCNVSPYIKPSGNVLGALLAGSHYPAAVERRGLEGPTDLPWIFRSRNICNRSVGPEHYSVWTLYTPMSSTSM